MLGNGVDWFDAHTHIGHNDPDGRKATAEEIIAGLDQAGHRRAMVFAMHEPDGYGPANDRVLRDAAASGGRLIPLARVSPHHEDAVNEARRCLEAGARGFKLHPRSDEFGLPHPAVEQVVALAHEGRMPVLFHAGRGIPHLGEAVVDLARRYPGARLILAHAGISDLSWIAAEAATLPNLFFDTAWWLVSDHLQLYASVPPGRILYASDMPYGPGRGHRVHLPARRPRRRLGPRGDAGHRRRAARARGGRRGPDRRSDRRPGPAPSARASSRPSASSPTPPRRCRSPSGAWTRPSRSRSRGWPATPAATTSSASCCALVDALLAMALEQLGRRPRGRRG